jgi:hypothetical protein
MKAKAPTSQVKMRDLIFIDDDRFLKAKGKELKNLSMEFDDGSVMTPIVKRGKIVGFTATDSDGKPQPVLHLHTQTTDGRGSEKTSGRKRGSRKGVDRVPRRMGRHRPPVKLPAPNGGGDGGASCWYCRCTKISCVCVPTQCA